MQSVPSADPRLVHGCTNRGVIACCGVEPRHGNLFSGAVSTHGHRTGYFSHQAGGISVSVGSAGRHWWRHGGLLRLSISWRPHRLEARRPNDVSGREGRWQATTAAEPGFTHLGGACCDGALHRCEATGTGGFPQRGTCAVMVDLRPRRGCGWRGTLDRGLSPRPLVGPRGHGPTLECAGASVA
jgi:hypothetical protein